MRRNVQAVVNAKLPAQKTQVLSSSKKDRSKVLRFKEPSYYLGCRMCVTVCMEDTTTLEN
nr:hypothetical protein [Methanosarcina barkeri]